MATSAGPVSDEHPTLDILPTWPRDTIAVLVTTESSGAPHAIPVSWPVRAGDRQVLLSLRNNRGSLARLRKRSGVALLVLGGGDVALSARGSARVLAEEMSTAPEYAAVTIDIEVIDDHRQGAFAVAAGIQRTVLDQSELTSLQARVNELHELAPR
jgi:hypothetical protein